MRIITQSHLSHLDEMEALRLKLKNEHAQIAFCQADAAAIAMKDFAQTKER